MRLVDADKIDFGEVFIGNSDFAKDTRKAAQTIVDSQQTAYDVDKVIEQLEEKVELAYKRYMDCPCNSPCFARYRTQYEERRMCLEIAKAGGVDDRRE